MKIAIVTHNVVRGDGQGRVNYELARFLLSKGIKVDLIADQVAPELLEHGASWHAIHPGFNNLHLIKVWCFKRLADQLMKRISDRYDVVLACGVTLSYPHTFNASHFVHGTWLQSPFHASKVASGPRSWYQWLFSAANAQWERQSYQNAQHVIAVSEMVRQELIEVGIPPQKISVVVNGVDPKEFAPGKVNRTSLGLPRNVPLGLFVGDIQSPIKNLDTLLHALPYVPAAHLAIAGRLDQSPYPDLARSLGLQDRTHFLGFRKDIPDLMRAADFFALPSRRDSCPLVLLEAMASALPIITSSTVGTANLVKGGSGLVMDGPDDMETLINGLQIFTASREKRRAMGDSARSVALRHSWDKMSARYLDLFERHIS